jgi:medium-chain acyl-[acyl-carrier-protein] hydrolase
MTGAPPTPAWIAFDGAGDDAEARVFCLAHAGAGAAPFRPWLPLFDERVRLCALRLPGRESRIAEPAIERLDELADALVDVIGPLADRRFALFGHCFGAIAAFELVRRLRRLGAPQPARLFVTGAAPSVELAPPFLHVLESRELAARLAALGTFEERALADADVFALLEPAIRGDFCAAETYRYRPEHPLTVPIAAFGTAADADVGLDELARWRHETEAPFALRLLPGKTLLEPGNWLDVGAAVAAAVRHPPERERVDDSGNGAAGERARGSVSAPSSPVDKRDAF